MKTRTINKNIKQTQALDAKPSVPLFPSPFSPLPSPFSSPSSSPSTYLSTYLSFFPSVYLSVYLSIYLSIYMRTTTSILAISSSSSILFLSWPWNCGDRYSSTSGWPAMASIWSG